MSVPACDRFDCYDETSHSHRGGALVGPHERFTPRLGYADAFAELEYGVFVDRGHGLMLQHTAKSKPMADMYAEGYNSDKTPVEVRVRRVVYSPWGRTNA